AGGAAASRVRQRGRSSPRRRFASKTEVADARESPWEDMPQEAAQEDLVSQCHGSPQCGHLAVAATVSEGFSSSLCVPRRCNVSRLAWHLVQTNSKYPVPLVASHSLARRASRNATFLAADFPSVQIWDR